MQKTNLLIIFDNNKRNFRRIVRLYYIIEALKDIHQITLLVPDNGYDYSFFPKEIKIIKFPIAHKKKFIYKIPKIRGLMGIPSGLGYYDRILMASWEQAIRENWKKSKFDYIFSMGSDAKCLSHIALNKVRETIGKRILYVHDPCPAMWNIDAYASKTTIHNFRLKFIFRKVFKQADALIFPSFKLAEWMNQKVPGLLQKSHIIPHIASPTRIIEKDKEEIKLHDIKKKMQGKFIISHVGDLYEKRNIYHFIQAIKKLMQDDLNFAQNALVLQVGNNNNPKKANIKANNNIIFIEKRIPYQQSLELMENTHLALVLEAAGPYSPYMPGKLADILYRKIPVLALSPRISEVRRILGPDYPFTAEPDNESEIYQAVLSAWEQWKNGNLHLPDAERLKKYVSPENFVNHFNKILVDLQRQRN